MPIDFACICGKRFRVADEFVGKRTKCPACGIALSVPAPPESLTDEEVAFRALSEGPEPEPTNRFWHEPSPSPPAPVPEPRPMPTPKAPTPPAPEKKTKKAAYRDPHAPRERQWTIEWGRVTGGIVGVLLGCGLLFGGLAVDRFLIWSPIIIMGGLFGIINGLLYKE